MSTKAKNTKSSQHDEKLPVMRSAFVVYNVNRDVIGIASSYEKAEEIFAQMYGDFDASVAITEFEVDRLHYA